MNKFNMNKNDETPNNLKIIFLDVVDTIPWLLVLVAIGALITLGIPLLFD